MQSLENFHQSLIKAAVYFKLDIPSHGYSLKVQVEFLSASLCLAMRRRSNWLLLVDDYRPDSLMTEYWPQPGDTRWGVGTVIVTTNDRDIIPVNNSHSAVVDVSQGLEKEEAVNLLIRMSNDSDIEGARRAVEQISCKPYDLEVLAIAHLHFKGVHAEWSWDQTLSQDISMETAVVETINSDSACGNLLYLFGLLRLSYVPEPLAKAYLTLRRNESHIKWELGLDRCLLVQLQDLATMISLNVKFWTIHGITYRFLVDLVKSEDDKQKQEREHVIKALRLLYKWIKDEEVVSEVLIVQLFKPSIEQLLLTSPLPDHQIWLLYVMADIAGMQGNNFQRHELLTKSLQVANQPNCSVHINDKICIVLELGNLAVHLGYCESEMLYRTAYDHLRMAKENESFTSALQFCHGEFSKNYSKHMSVFQYLSTALAIFNSQISVLQTKKEICSLMAYLMTVSGVSPYQTLARSSQHSIAESSPWSHVSCLFSTEL